jgi:hypothetical protein
MSLRHGWLLRPLATGRTLLLLALAGSLVVMVLRAWRAGGPPVEMSVFSMFSAFGCASIGCHYMLTAGHDDWRRFLAAVAATAGAAFVIVALRSTLSPVIAAKTLLVAIGGVGALAYVRDATRAQSTAQRLASLSALRDALIIPIAAAQAGLFLGSQLDLNPVYDAYIHSFEQTLGMSVERIAVASYDRLPPLAWLATGCYLALPVALVAVFVKQPSRDLQTRVLLAILAAGVSGFLLYRVSPAVGPKDAFAVLSPGSLPRFGVADVKPIWTPGHVPRNGMPSLHAAWAALILFNMAGFTRRGRAVLGAFVGFSLWAAVARYQHWVLDLVVAVPFAVAIQLAIAGQPGRSPSRSWIGAAVCGLIVLGWLVGLREGVFLEVSSWLSWLAVLSTLVLPLWLARPGPSRPVQFDAASNQ